MLEFDVAHDIMYTLTSSHSFSPDELFTGFGELVFRSLEVTMAGEAEVLLLILQTSSDSSEGLKGPCPTMYLFQAGITEGLLHLNRDKLLLTRNYTLTGSPIRGIVPQHRRPATSSVPYVAEAAAVILMNFTFSGGKRYMDTWALLGKFVDASLAPQGIIGELIGRVLNILAMDRAINKLPTSSHDH